MLTQQKIINERKKEEEKEEGRGKEGWVRRQTEADRTKENIGGAGNEGRCVYLCLSMCVCLCVSLPSVDSSSYVKIKLFLEGCILADAEGLEIDFYTTICLLVLCDLDSAIKF